MIYSWFGEPLEVWARCDCIWNAEMVGERERRQCRMSGNRDKLFLNQVIWWSTEYPNWEKYVSIWWYELAAITTGSLARPQGGVNQNPFALIIQFVPMRSVHSIMARVGLEEHTAEICLTVYGARQRFTCRRLQSKRKTATRKCSAMGRTPARSWPKIHCQVYGKQV